MCFDIHIAKPVMIFYRNKFETEKMKFLSRSSFEKMLMFLIWLFVVFSGRV